MPFQLIYPTLSGPAARDDEVALRYPEPPPDRPYVLVNMVATVDGKASIGGKVRKLGGRSDRRMMHLIRSTVDAIVVGAATLRAEPVNPQVDAELSIARLAAGKTAQPLAVTVSATLDLKPEHRFFVNGRDRTLVLTTISALATASTDLERVATLGVFGEERVDLAAALAELRQRWDVRQLLCEGGPSLNQQLLDLDLIDEIFVTTAPKLAGGDGPGLVRGEDATNRIRANLDLVSVFVDESALFARYRVRREPPA